MTVDDLIEFLNQCRDRGMGNSSVILSNDDGSVLTQANFKTVITVATNDDDEIELASISKGKDAVCIW